MDSLSCGSGSWNHPEFRSELGELGKRQSLSEEVSDVEIGSNIRDSNQLILDILTNLKVSDVDVFGTLRS